MISICYGVLSVMESTVTRKPQSVIWIRIISRFPYQKKCNIRKFMTKIILKIYQKTYL